MEIPDQRNRQLAWSMMRGELYCTVTTHDFAVSFQYWRPACTVPAGLGSQPEKRLQFWRNLNHNNGFSMFVVLRLLDNPQESAFPVIVPVPEGSIWREAATSAPQRRGRKRP